ncbi:MULTISPECIES: YegP family protein [unclassified Xanthobacter]|uniref:YegP family protein n=1 Tax=unclassified Xanthobacter TaxID=2623496 RepID=UPI001EE0D07E|nr:MULTISPECIES: DUF1508 domain-containing protein [unclassified Xanthobacter]
MDSCRDAKGDLWEVYSSATGWRWRRTASNGRVVGASTEGYAHKADCIANARRNGMTCNPA